MRVSRIQAEENRQTVINVASQLFRQHGFDGIGLKDLMAGAGMTQGGFYKQFSSKDDLVAQASKRALESAFHRWSEAASARPEDPLGAAMAFYLSAEHCAEIKDGCPIVALGSDAARQGPDVKAFFEAGIKDYLGLVGSWLSGDKEEDEGCQTRAMAILSTMVGAVLLSRAVNDEHLAAQFLEAATQSVTSAVDAGDDRQGLPQ